MLQFPREESFSLTSDRYDQSLFLGRFLKFLHLVDPRTLVPNVFFGQSLTSAKELLTTYKRNPDAEWNAGKLWTARKIVESQVHPDTGEIIPPPFRMSGFVPFGSPIIVGMLVSGTSPLSTVFWQSLNQSHNAAVNYFNRNASAAVSTKQLLTSYLLAVTTAVSVKLLFDQAVVRLSRPALARFTPFFAVASANVLNVVIMRRAELNTGITVCDQHGSYVGHSVAAAEKAIRETATTRALLPVPILALSPLMVLMCEAAMPQLMKVRSLNIAVQTCIVVGNFLTGLPLSMSFFKQQGELSVERLEPELQLKAEQLGMKQGSVVTYNKGL